MLSCRIVSWRPAFLLSLFVPFAAALSGGCSSNTELGTSKTAEPSASKPEPGSSNTALGPAVASGKRFYSINLAGAEVYEQPSLQARIARRIAVGDSLLAQAIIPTNEARPIGADLWLRGRWVKIDAAGTAGYIFSTDLSEHRPLLS